MGDNHGRRRRSRAVASIAAAVALAAGGVGATARAEHPASRYPPAPAPERIEIRRMPLPPRPDADGRCRHRTGCITNGQSGGFLPDNRTIAMMAEYAGSPDGSPYTGAQLILLKVDGTTFENGEPWKCLTCGVPPEHRVGMTSLSGEPYPQPFGDGRRVLAGTNVVECAGSLAGPGCTPKNIRVYPIWWQVTPDGSGAGGSMRELRLHPDSVHLGWNRLLIGPLGGVDPAHPANVLQLEQFGYFGRLRFNPAPRAGEPRGPRYELDEVSLLMHQSTDGTMNSTFIHRDPRDPTKLKYTRSGAVGEFRGFTGDGTAALGMCWAESNNSDICATDLTSGASRRLTVDPSYTDPVAVSPDSRWTVALENRTDDRMMYIAGLPGVPPINQIDHISAGAAAAGYNDGQRRFFQPFLLDMHAERPGYRGQQINACRGPATARTPGSLCDPNWGTRADPRWSPDGTKVVYYQRLVEPPECPGVDPTRCPPSTEPGGHTLRVMVAHLVDRKPHRNRVVAPVADDVPWGTPYEPGDPDPQRSHIPSGSYTLDGRHSGVARVTVTEHPAPGEIVSATYENYSDDGRNFLDGTESVHTEGLVTTFHSDLRLSGAHTGHRWTTPGGYTVSLLAFFAGQMAYAGYMTTTIDGRTYHPPLPTR